MDVQNPYQKPPSKRALWFMVQDVGVKTAQLKLWLQISKQLIKVARLK